MQRFRTSGLIPLILACLAVLAADPSGVQAQYTVPDGDTFAGAGVPSAPPADAVIDLEGDAILSASLTMPGGGGLSINGAAAGSTITVNTGFRFSNTAANQPRTLTLGGGPIKFTGTGTPSTQQGGVFFSSTTSSLTINGDLIADGNLTTNEGGVFYGGALTVAGNVTLTNNAAGYNVTGIYSGGAIRGTTVELGTADGSNVTLTGNFARNTGGGVGGSTVTIGNANAVVILDNNTAGTENPSSGTGGAAVAATTVTIEGSTISLSGNRAVGLGGRGGGISASQMATLTGAVTANNNTAYDGGAIYSAVIVVNGTFAADSNSAVFNGGALRMTTGSITVTDATHLAGNTTGHLNAGQGGAIYGGSGDIKLATQSGDATLTGNVAGGHGGAIYLATGTITSATIKA
ncbi:MAG: hypothetical protein LBG44_07270 [Gemmatimonadota bacterium]|nr:hypothetical protein [Gemmatimonadota bacterium]